MSFRPAPHRWFGDIVDAVAMIEQFTSGMDFESFRSNPLVVAAVERKLRLRRWLLMRLVVDDPSGADSGASVKALRSELGTISRSGQTQL